MARKTIFVTAAAAALMALAMAPASASAATNLLVNGSFDDIGAGASPEGWGGLTYYVDGTHPGHVALPGWTVESGSVDLTDTHTTWGPAADGEYSLDINGWDAGTISQGFNTIVGGHYTVSFAYSRNAAGAPDPATADVTAGGNVFHISTANDSSLYGYGGHMLWQTGTFDFVGSGHDVIRLAATIPGNGGVFFDKVSVSGGAVPEPAAWALMISGFGMAGTVLRRRRAQVAAAA
ncbi:MAG: PEPxxWA-CTERM sorting domain-containing protein [Caulobacterales bacterium]|nr:PEPxxWA-CTERM sorting domain-containing protein [Caulobacterales bacterium]